MFSSIHRLLLIGLLAQVAAAPATAADWGNQTRMTMPAAAGAFGQAPAQPDPRADVRPAAPAATTSQPVTVQAGTGVLLRLPSPAATVMSADPSVARVQPASPTSLFLMGVAPGRTTVIATSDTGSAIVQYDVTVSPGTRAVATPSAPAQALGVVSAATVVAIQNAIAQTVNGASGIRAYAAGSAVVLTGTVSTSLAAQQAEAVARGYVGEKANVVDNL